MKTYTTLATLADNALHNTVSHTAALVIVLVVVVVVEYKSQYYMYKIQSIFYE